MTHIVTCHTENCLNNGIGIIGMPRFKKRGNNYNENDENNQDYNQQFEQSSLGDDDSYEVPEEDEEPYSEEDTDNLDEFNQNIGWDGRHKDDLY